TICLKCLEKDPRQRYATAAALADDLQRFLKGLPITARPVSAPARLVKWAKRRPEAAALVVLLGVAAIGPPGLGVVRSGEHQEERAAAARLAPRARDILLRNCYSCHGDTRHEVEGELAVLDHALLLDPARRLVVAGNVVESRLIHRIEDGSMPPEHEEEFPRLSSDELTDLKKWVLGGAPGFAGPAAGDEPAEAFAPRAIAVKKIFR